MARPDARPALEAWVREAGTLARAAASHPGAETLQGRGRVYVVPAPMGGGRWVVRHYHRGGAVARLLGDRYLRIGTPRPVREFRAGVALEALGIPTPSHIGAAVYTAGPWRRGDLVTELVPDSHDLATVLFDDDAAAMDRGSAMSAAGGLVRLLHERGVVHRDLNLKNVLIQRCGDASRDSGGSVAGRRADVRALVLDLDRATVGARVGRRARRRMIQRFWRSARKWEAATGRPLGAALVRSFEEGYAR